MCISVVKLVKNLEVDMLSDQVSGRGRQSGQGGRGGRGGRGGQGGRDRRGGRGGRGGRGRGRSQSGRRGSFKARDCIDFKLLGECERYDVGECWFSHTNQERYTTSVTVEIPNKVPMIMATKRFMGFLRRIVECSVKATSSTSVSVSM